MHLPAGNETYCEERGKKKYVYVINEKYLATMGFEKLEGRSGANEHVYRYYRPGKTTLGVELIYEHEFGVLSVEEFCVNRKEAAGSYSYTLVGQFRIDSDEDLAFIFSKSIRLNYLFNVYGRRV